MSRLNIPPCRAVADEQRSLALGVSSVLFRVFGSIPGPILFGAIVDSGCTYWQTECGRRANCWVYDNYLLSTRAYAFCFMCVLVCAVSTFLVWVFYPPVTVCWRRKGSVEMGQEMKGTESAEFDGVPNPIHNKCDDQI